ncbi:hypothetical protein [Novosphingobium sp. CECT 9465]|uniref:hypothetical protein n=1 Tax=Novosphingobium sp. CECT 9465 TaxID=2829794 RepID=UPI001E3A40E4|nr:hypothetical protein [Novosphingobium sp. CECT 9465]
MEVWANAARNFICHWRFGAGFFFALPEHAVARGCGTGTDLVGLAIQTILAFEVNGLSRISVAAALPLGGDSSFRDVLVMYRSSVTMSIKKCQSG